MSFARYPEVYGDQIRRRVKYAASKEFKNWLGDVRTTSPSNARDLKVQEFKSGENTVVEPFMGEYTIRKGVSTYRKGFSEDSPQVTTGYYTVYDGEKPIASMCQGHLVVDKKYRGRGIGTAVAKEFMQDFPEYRPSSVTPKSKRMFERALTGSFKNPLLKKANPQSKGELSPAPGTLPIPAGAVRLFHYTRPDSVESIRQSGLLKSKGRGDDLSGTGASAGIWASTKVPTVYELRDRPYVEFWATPEQISHNANYPDNWKMNKETGRYEKQPKIDQEMLDAWLNSGEKHVIMYGDVPTSQILTIHEPWMDEARYILKEWDNPDCEWLHNPEEVEKFRTTNTS